METEVGLAIGSKLRETQQGPPERVLQFAVRSDATSPYRTVRWTRRVLDEDPEAAGKDDPLAEHVATREVDVGHVLYCLEAPEFVECWAADELQALLRTVDSGPPSVRRHLLVTGLKTHLTKLERAASATHAAAEAGPPLRRGVLEEAVAGLPISHPHICVRMAEDVHAAAEHVVLLSSSIARSAFQKRESEEWLEAHNRRIGAPMESLLARHPVPPLREEAMRALCVLPSIAPQIAHAVLAEFGDVGALMDALVEAEGNPVASRALRLRIESLWRTGASRPTRVGPKAAASLATWLLCTDPAQHMHSDD